MIQEFLNLLHQILQIYSIAFAPWVLYFFPTKANLFIWESGLNLRLELLLKLLWICCHSLTFLFLRLIFWCHNLKSAVMNWFSKCKLLFLLLQIRVARAFGKIWVSFIKCNCWTCKKYKKTFEIILDKRHCELLWFCATELYIRLSCHVLCQILFPIGHDEDSKFYSPFYELLNDDVNVTQHNPKSKLLILGWECCINHENPWDWGSR